MFESEHPGSIGKKTTQSRRKQWHDFVKLKPCRTFIAARFSMSLLLVFSVVVWDKGRKLGPRNDHTYLIQQGKNAERISLYQIKAVLVILVVYE